MRIAMLVLALGAMVGGCAVDLSGEGSPVCAPDPPFAAWQATCGEPSDQSGSWVDSDRAVMHAAVCGDAWSAWCSPDFAAGGIQTGTAATCSANEPEAVECPPGQAPSCAIIPCDGEWHGPGAE